MSNGYNSRLSNRDYGNEVGHLDLDAPQTSKGKKLLEWTYTASACEDKDVKETQTKITVLLFIIDGVITFKAQCPLFVKPMSDTDINKLRENVETYLTDQAAAMTGMIWEDWFMVTVDGDNSDFSDSKFSSLGADLRIQVSKIKRGIHPTTQVPVTINDKGIVVNFPTASSLHKQNQDENTEPKPWHYREKHEERAYIPATPENRLALDNILGKMALLRSSLAEILSQELIQEKLQNIESVLQLPAPEER